MADATFHGSRQQCLALLRSLPSILSGRSPDSTGTVKQLLGAVGLQALSLIKTAYIEKAAGNTDEAGIKWAPLSHRYIAYHRRHPALSRRRRYAGKVGRGRRPLLTAEQDKLWRGIFASTYRRLQAQGVTDAKGSAAAMAWAAVKRIGGKTILQEYGGTRVQIGIDTSRLISSLSPASASGPISSDQVFRIGDGSVAVGTNVRYAPHFHAKRPIWPDEGAIPESWYTRIAQTMGDGIRLVLTKLLAR